MLRVLSSMCSSHLIKKKSRRHLSGKRKVSPLTLKIWSINIIAIFVVLIAVLHLDRYEDSLIQSELEALEHQAELFADALSEVAVTNNPGISELPFEHRCPECYKQICFRVSRSIKSI